jgi:hypothetical protein
MKTCQEIWDELRKIYGEGLMKNFTTTPSTIGEFTAVCFGIGYGFDVLLNCGPEYALVSPYEATGSEYGRGQVFLDHMANILGCKPYCKFFTFWAKRPMYMFIEKNHDKHFQMFQSQGELCHGLQKI